MAKKKEPPKNEAPDTAPAPEAKFEPRTIRLNGDEFLVELEPTCTNAYDFENNTEWDYWPEMIDNPNFKLTAEQDEEVRKLRVLQFVGFDKTVTIELMKEDRAVVWPSDIIYGTQLSSGAYKVVSLIAGGKEMKARYMRIKETHIVDRDKIIVNRDILAVNQRTREALEKIKKGEIPAAAQKTTHASAQETTPAPANEPQSHKVRNPKGRRPATPAEKQADKEIDRQWQEYCKREADDGNHKPSWAAFSISEYNPTKLKIKQIEEALERVRKRKRMKSRLSGN